METTKEVLKIVENLKLKGYEFLSKRAGNQENFFVWKKGNHEYLRLTLLGIGFKQDKVYWNLEYSFKPFNYKHNHKEGSKYQSEVFDIKARDLYLSRFLDMVEEIKRYVKEQK